MDDALLEAISDRVHQAWAAEKVRQGFADHVFGYGPDLFCDQRCGILHEKHHPDMLPYSELADRIQEYDRATVRAVFGAIEAAGFQVVPATNENDRSG